ncbi:hypothetical protein RAE19_01605 [Rhodoferax sp. TBRC 17660]|uniref:Uncharacterized protein n=1 Tax=Rhodoferax potami TaxID=3068338 RepID=A0ABU3KI50_9BURK|nr:hypothetical protein [Rhodoferax sp. TBRC 17660]MDT7517449.1 hypothetical protein [Rhodoferax sp. TBRC 17660]
MPIANQDPVAVSAAMDNSDICPPAHLLPAGATGSRRRRLWDLGTHCHCPLVGVSFAYGGAPAAGQ